MNYRHAFHAGNFADVVKHAVLALLIERLKAKETAFRVIDTHAGTGLYDLAGEEASRTEEWKGGIGRLIGAKLDRNLAALLSPYLAAVEAAQPLTPSPAPDRVPRLYPGSPWIARHLLRRQDRLTAVELHPEDAVALAQLFARDRQVKAIALDGWKALGAFVPPKERRGLVLVDPPFEERDEFDRLLAGLVKAERRWPGGVYALWYPVKDLAAIKRFRAALAESGLPRLLRAELTIRKPVPDLFSGTGLVIANPPWQFQETLQTLLGGLAPILSVGRGAGIELDAISTEESMP
jgi:23S rRNA (adenine2030-N6)-methyltransferase